MSTGPRSPEGIARIVRANKRRARKPRLFPEVSERQERRISKTLKEAEARRRVFAKVDQLNNVIEQRGVSGVNKVDFEQVLDELADEVEVFVRTNKAALAKMPPWIRDQLQRDAELVPLQKQVRAALDRRATPAVTELLAKASAPGPVEERIAAMPAERVERYQRAAVRAAEDRLGRALQARVERPTSYLSGARTLSRRRVHTQA